MPRATLAIVLFVLTLTLSHQLAKVGEPTSKWIWCDVMEICDF